jgi:YfiH family protein
MFYVKPFKKSEGITAGFSGANLDAAENGSAINGIDMGINTLTNQSITQKNREYFLNSNGLKSDQLAIVKQVHGTRVLYTEKPGLIGEADGLVTDAVNLTLGILVADCAVVLIADTRKKVICALHAGWRGTAGNIISSGIGKMRDLGANDFVAWISPCIGTENFEVGQEVAEAFPSAYVIKGFFQKYHVDLQGYLMHQLVCNGVSSKNIKQDGRCTYSDQRFYSYRRQGANAGRMLGFITIT